MPAKRIILMYISEVSGHHSATIAIEKALKILSPDIETLNINAFNYTNPISEKIVNSIYMGIIKRTPKIWDYLYDNPKIVKKVAGIKKSIHRFNSPKLKVLFDKFKPDAVVCAQAFPCGMVADFKTTYKSNLPLIAVLTDYIPHAYWIYDTVDYYIAPSNEVMQNLIEKGVLPERIKPLGIPFDPKFNNPIDKNKIRQKLNLNPDIFTVLIMGGGQGLGPVKKIIKSLEKVETYLQEIIITGINIKLYNSLKKKIKKYKKNIRLLKFIDNINELMSVSDVIITKPGGITTAEALSKKLPMVIVSPIPGQEESNAQYLTKKSAAIKIDKAESVNLVIQDLINDKDKLQRLSQAASLIAKPNASLNIASLVLSTAK